jgi:hypothetical protein
MLYLNDLYVTTAPAPQFSEASEEVLHQLHKISEICIKRSLILTLLHGTGNHALLKYGGPSHCWQTGRAKVVR